MTSHHRTPRHARQNTRSPFRTRALSLAAATVLTATTATGVASAQDLPSNSSGGGSSDDPTVASVLTSLTETDVIGSLFSVVGSITSGSAAAGSWQSVPGSETAG
ncbi:MAG: hypothetical protein ACTH1D_04140 [Mycobacteriaceae bacterium]|uniref:hypothetical protein n=1 Tax=Corynebacterium sp. TaxID=1720 RepID=UPI003F947A27